MKKFTQLWSENRKSLMEMRMDMVTEECPDCGTENTFKWSVLRNGYPAFCHKCGFPMMLCSECMIDNDNFCDWNGDKVCVTVMVGGILEEPGMMFRLMRTLMDMIGPGE